MAESKSGKLKLSALRFLGVHPDELPMALWMALYFFLAMACASVVRALQNALYLGHIGFDWRLPVLYLLLAIVSGGVVLLYRHLARSYSRVWVSILTLSVLIIGLVLFTPPITAGEHWIYPVFYLWGGVFSLLVPTQGWLLSYELYTTRKAKRIFAILGAGGILGGAFGGFYAAYLSYQINTLWMLVHVIVGLCLMQLVLLAVHRRRKVTAEPVQEKVEDSELEDSSIGELWKSRYILVLAGLVFTVGATTTVIDLQFKWLLEERYSGSPQDITHFFGIFLGVVFSVSLLVQLILTSRVIRGVGVASTLLVLPAVLLAGAFPALLLGTFWFMIVPRMVDGSLRSSLHRVSVELLYIPIDPRKAITAKGIIDLVVTRLGDSFGALVLLAVLSSQAVSITGMSWLIVGGGGVWLFLAVLLGREYIQTLRQSLAEELGGLPASWRFEGDQVKHMLVSALDSPAPSKVLLALKLLSGASMERTQLDESVELSGVYVNAPWLEKVEPLVQHNNIHVAAAALNVLATRGPAKYADMLEQRCGCDGIPDLLCLFYLERYEDDAGRSLDPARTLGWADEADPERAVILARLMAKSGKEEFLGRLRQWMESPSQRVARAAVGEIGRYRQEEDIAPLIECLESSWSRVGAQRSLVRFGDRAVDALTEVIQDPSTGGSVRRAVPVILSRIGTPKAQEALLQCLYLQDSIVAFRALKGLNKIRSQAEIVFDAEAFFPILQVWAREYYELLNLHLLLGEDESLNDSRLLKKAVEERVEWGIERVFRGLGLFLPARDAHFSYLAYTGRQTDLKENAIELLDSLIHGELRPTIMPILSGESDDEKARAGREIFGLSSSLDQVLSDALFQTDPWLKCCVIATIRSEQRQGLRRHVEGALGDTNPIVQETAEWALSSWADSN